LSGQKSQLYEGGIRVPMVWLLPANLADIKSPAGSTVDVPVSGVDIYPTFAALAGIDVKKQTLDGVNISPLFSAAGKIPSRALYWYFPAYTLENDVDDPEESVGSRVDQHFSQVPAAVILRDGWKLIRYYSSNEQSANNAQRNDNTPELYYLPDDPLEKTNRFSSEKKRAGDMMGELESWLQKTGAAVTLPANTAYHP